MKRNLMDFAHSYITRSGRIDDARLARDVARIHGALTRRQGARHDERNRRSGPPDNPGSREIGFTISDGYNASRILFDNLAAGRGDRLALTGPGGTRSYAKLCAEASQWGHGFASLGLQRGDRILMFLDDTPAYPAAFFRRGPRRLRAAVDQHADAAGAAAVSISRMPAHPLPSPRRVYPRFDAVACKDTPLQTLIVVNGTSGEHAAPKTIAADAWLQNLPPPISLKLAPTATRWRSGCIRRARPGGRRASCICSTNMAYSEQPLRATCSSFGPTISASRCRKFSSPTVLQRHHLPVLGRRRHTAAAGPAKTGGDL